ncbi:hypothetical protein SAPIO_CDS2578 [Scedosporium apiospermum]|uniref:Uncharacterized protein n=1 Tax=Pseudallescheria apiosperma TaxID=563466 RepID=A0A084GCS7_PSEDA|nr:uncharacterized protein SAPIO_CDS2578 [Scedosporium apiospermum]KEZ45139.1 hypothetical protein SAPIO_CDS2578 [Scedosporium apiospermum]
MSRVLLRTYGTHSARLCASQPARTSFLRPISTLSSNPKIKVFKDHPAPSVNLLTYLDTTPPSQTLAIGQTTTLPPTPQSFQENPRFLSILNEVLIENAHNDPDLISQARAFAGPGGTSFSLGVAGLYQNQRRKAKKLTGDGGGGGASAQGGAGGAGRGGHVHLSDTRNPPDFGRIAWPEDILGSVEVDAAGEIVGRLAPSGTYRIITNQGILGLSPFLTEKLIARLREEEKKEGSS